MAPRPRPARAGRESGTRTDASEPSADSPAADAVAKGPTTTTPLSAPARYLLRQATVLDEAGGFTGPLDVAVEEGRVTRVGREIAADGLESIDFSGLWLMPGLFDCHDHVALTTIEMTEVLSMPVTRWTLEAAHNARLTLEAGVTFVRDLSGADRGLRDAIAAGSAAGPRLQISVVLICQTGGHGDGYLSGAGLEAGLVPDFPGRPSYVVDGPETMRHTVRAVLRAGADWIKLATTGGLVSEHDQPLIPELTPEEIAVAVFEAARKGKAVAAHAYGGEGLSNAVAAGVRSIEHGGFLTEEQAAAMAKAGCFLVPTLSAMRDTLRWATEGTLTPAQCAKILAFGLDIGQCVRIAKDYGVKLASGTDYITRAQHGSNLEEVRLMHEAGLTVEEALLAATAGGAELCGVEADHGRIAEGYVFDAIVLERDPGDLASFGQPGVVSGVFQSGRAAVPHPRLPAALGGRS